MKTDVTYGIIDALFKKAREYEPDLSGVEPGFETRVLARLRADRDRYAVPVLFDWAWRLLPIFTALVVAMGIWSYTATPQVPVDLQAAISAEYDHALSFNIFNGDQT